MKAWEALKALEEGKKIRIKTWPYFDYIHLNDRKIVINSQGDYATCSPLALDENWELYEPKSENFVWVSKQLLEGKKVTRKSWPAKEYIFMADNKLLYKFSCSMQPEKFFIGSKELLAKDWILAE